MAEQAPGLLLAMMDVAPQAEAQFNRLYDEEHVPERLAVPGFRRALRFKAVEGSPAYQALYDLDSPDVLESAAYRALADQASEGWQQVRAQCQNNFRGVYRQIYPAGASALPVAGQVGGVLLVGLEVPREHEEEFHAWYNTEHVPFLSAVPGVLLARRFAPVDGSGRYLAVYELSNPEVPMTEAWARAANTPWSARVRSYYHRWLRIRSRALAPVTR